MSTQNTQSTRNAVGSLGPIFVHNMRNTKPDLDNKKHIKVDRTSVLGNPFHMKTEEDRELVIEKYRLYFENKIESQDEAFLNELKRVMEIYKHYGVIELFCWCKPKKCHAEIIANYIIHNAET